MNEMSYVMKRLCFVMIISLGGPVAAQTNPDLVSTNSLLVGCRALVENAPTGDMMQIGACAGAIAAVVDIGRELRRACVPESNSTVNAARATIEYADESAVRRSEPFGRMALRAIGERWPCR